jgi:hypothetical protein
MISDGQRKLLIRAKELIEKGWAKDTFARNSKGKEVSDYSPEACKFCLVGAIRRAAYELDLVNGTAPSINYWPLIDHLRNLLPKSKRKNATLYESIDQFNDACVTKKPVIKLIERGLSQ